MSLENEQYWSCSDQQSKILTFSWHHQTQRKKPIHIGTLVHLQNDFVIMWVKVTSFGGGEYGNEINGTIAGFRTRNKKETQPLSKCNLCSRGIPYRLGSTVQFYEQDCRTEVIF
jgi:hypothetical protein